jgi:hypothetical protein
MDVVAVALAESRKTAARLATQTHFIGYDAPARRNQTAIAACGTIVARSRHDVAPTCPECQAALANWETFTF